MSDWKSNDYALYVSYIISLFSSYSAYYITIGSVNYFYKRLFIINYQTYFVTG